MEYNLERSIGAKHITNLRATSNADFLIAYYCFPVPDPPKQK